MEKNQFTAVKSEKHLALEILSDNRYYLRCLIIPA